MAAVMRSYGAFGLILLVIFVLTLFFNSFVETEKSDFDRMQRDWTREEHHVMDELRATMAEMKKLIKSKTDAVPTSSNDDVDDIYPTVDELREAGLDERVINIVQEALLKKRVNKRKKKSGSGSLLLRQQQRRLEQQQQQQQQKHYASQLNEKLKNEPTDRVRVMPTPPPQGYSSSSSSSSNDADGIKTPEEALLRDPPPAEEDEDKAKYDNRGQGKDKEEEGVGRAEPEKLEEIKQEMVHAWKAYELYAWGRDVVNPVSRRGSDEQYRMAITLLDSLDTLWIMGLKDKFNKGVEWVRDSCVFGRQEVSVFETTIRALGGLLAAYHLSQEKILLQKAEELALKMEPAFDTPTGFPKSTVRLSTGESWCPSWSHNSASFSEVTSLYLEWNYLSQATNNPRFTKRVEKVMETMIKMPKIQGLYAQWVSVDTGRFTSGDITLGSRVDSAYEYLEKAWRSSGRKRKDFLQEYLDRVDSVEEHLIRKSSPNGLTYIQQCTFSKSRCHGQFDHLVCFAPAMFALGAQEPLNPKKERHMQLARELMETCWQSYARMPTGLAPEIIKFDKGEDFYVDSRDTHNLLRPETIESLFVMWRVTHEQKYRDQAWSIFKSFQKWAKVDNAGYSSLNSVKIHSLQERSFRDHTESFFFAETMKYLYLIFTDDSVMPVDKYVFNTEAHAFPIT